MKRSGKWLSILLSLFAMAGMLAVFSITASAEDGIPYVVRKWDSQAKTVTEETMYCTDYSVINVHTTTLNGWYVVNQDLDIEDRLEVNGTANIILSDGAKLYCIDGIHVGTGNTLRIFAQENGTGELYCYADTDYNAAIGSDDEESSCGEIEIHGGVITADTEKSGTDGAGIGGGNESRGGRIFIYGGSVTAIGGDYGAGIGSGDESGVGGNVYIYGGNVKATGGTDGAGIGGGNESDAAAVEIWGGNVTATAGSDAAGIGGGDEGNGSKTVIYGGKVTATGGKYGAGIGGGDADGDGGYGGETTIYGGEVTATGGKYGAGIGGGEEGSGGTVVIKDGEVTAKGGENGAGIGGGKKGAGGTASINGGNVTATGGENGAGIGSGEKGAGGTVTIKGGKVIATGGKSAAGIGSGNCDGIEGGGNAGTVTIEGGNVTANAGYNGAGIGGGNSGKGAVTTINGGTVIAQGQNSGSGIGSGKDGTAEDIIINGGNVTATSQIFGVCIGCRKEMTKTIRITGGNVTARIDENYWSGSTTWQEWTGPAAIGSFNDMNGEIIISGGTVDAYALKGAAIGSGRGYNMNGTITISGGTVKVNTRNKYGAGAGIGAGAVAWSEGYGSGGKCSGTINITGGRIETMVADSAEAIGSGEDGDSSKMTLNIADGLTVIAWPKYQYKASNRVKGCHNPIIDIKPCTEHEFSDKNKNRCIYCNYKEKSAREVFVGYNLSLGGDIGLIYYLDITDEEAKNKSVNFNWSYYDGGELKNKSYSGELVKDEEDGLYFAVCPVAAAEMGYGVNASITIDGEEYTDNYAVSRFADTILTGEGFAKSYIEYQNSKGYKGEERLEQLRTLIKAMLDYGSWAQVYFDRAPDQLQNSKFVTNDTSSPYYYVPEAVTPGMINTGASDMSKGLEDYGLEYVDSTIVYLSMSSMRHYYRITDQARFDAIKDSITFEGEKCGYTEKDGTIYFELPNIAAPDLDTQFTLRIGDTEYRYSALDYVKACLNSEMTPESLKELSAATYRYNKAANIFFGDEDGSMKGSAGGVGTAEEASASVIVYDDAAETSANMTDQGSAKLAESPETGAVVVEEDGEKASLDEYETPMIDGIKDIRECKVSGLKNMTYTGKAVTQKITVKDGDKVLKKGKDYSVAYTDNKNAGEATVIIIGKGEYGPDIRMNFTISKAKNPLTVKGKTAKVKYSKLKKASQKLSVSKVLSFKKKGKGEKVYTKLKGNKKIIINQNTGKVTLKKGLKKGTYRVKVKVTAKGNNNYKSKTLTRTFRIRIK